MNNKLRALWQEGKPGINAWLAIPSPVSAEVTARQGFDAVTVDLQHGLVDYAAALPMLQAMQSGGATPMARVPWLEPGIIMKMLDAGALGIICPMINTAEEAARFVGYCRYAPDGERSFGPTRALPLYGADYPRLANNEVITLAMVETRSGLANVEEIVATPGLSGVYIGPSDLSLSLGYTPKLDQEEPAVMAAIERILGAAHGAGLRAGIHCLSPAYARSMITLGFDLVTVGSDLRLLASACATALSETRA